MPDFALELDLACGGPVAGLDEAGRGPWAGPVVAAAAWLDPGRTPAALQRGLDDSKALSASRRGDLFLALKDAARGGNVAFAVASATVAEIDEINILQASLLAMRRAAADLAQVLGAPLGAALIDGPHCPPLPCPAHGVVKGDSRSLSIAAASILAKVTRDRLMEDLAERYPGYGWQRNKGYGTAEHRLALERLGVTAEHRRSFRPVQALLET